jgi:TPR repeat protein
MSCMLVKYCNGDCQRNHWPTHKKQCKRRAAELRDEALFKDPPAKEDCPICFLPMPLKLVSCLSLPPATISSVPINDFAEANVELADEEMYGYYPCCGKSVCAGCAHSFCKSGNDDKCPFCNSDRSGKTDEEEVADMMRRVEANDPASIYVLASFYYHGLNGLQQDEGRAMELWTIAVALGSSDAHNHLGNIYDLGGDLKKAKFHFEAAAMAGHEIARYNLGLLEAQSGNMEQAVKHWTIAASAGNFTPMHNLLLAFKRGFVSRESIDSTLIAYNNACAEMRSDTRDALMDNN